MTISSFLQLYSTVQFGGISAFHTRISDPVVGGTYMTLLATFTNLGGTWPRFFVLKGVDFFSVATCNIKEQGLSVKGQSHIMTFVMLMIEDDTSCRMCLGPW
jgi:hypothetical protein